MTVHLASNTRVFVKQNQTHPLMRAVHCAGNTERNLLQEMQGRAAPPRAFSASTFATLDGQESLGLGWMQAQLGGH